MATISLSSGIPSLGVFLESKSTRSTEDSNMLAICYILLLKHIIIVAPVSLKTSHPKLTTVLVLSVHVVTAIFAITVW